MIDTIIAMLIGVFIGANFGFIIAGLVGRKNDVDCDM